jgi:methionyl-tRNA formyltransferase
LRIVFMGSPQPAVHSLEALVNNGFDVVSVLTQPDRPAGRGQAPAIPPVKKAALSLRIPVLQPESLKSAEAVSQLAGLKPDVVVVCAFGQILTQAVLDIPPRQCLNVHFSLLPRHRGAFPVAAAILAGDEFTGVTIQLVRKKLDSGPVLARAAIPVDPRDDTGSLTEKLALVGAGLLQESLIGWMKNEVEPRPQDEEKATYYGQIKKETGQIDWNMPAVEIWRRVRAFHPWPGAYTFFRGKQLKIHRAIVVPSAEDTVAAGKVVALAGKQAPMGIGTGDGVLGVLELQIEGRKAMDADEFLRGRRDLIDTVLPC